MTTKVRVSFTVSQCVADWLNALKKEQHVNRSAYVNTLILQDLKKLQKE